MFIGFNVVSEILQSVELRSVTREALNINFRKVLLLNSAAFLQKDVLKTVFEVMERLAAVVGVDDL